MSLFFDCLFLINFVLQPSRLGGLGFDAISEVGDTLFIKKNVCIAILLELEL